MEKLYGNKNNTILLLSCSAVLGIMFNVLFYKYRFGINYPIYLALILVMTYWALSFREDFNRKTYLFMSVAMMLIASNFALSKNELLLGFDFLSVPVLYFITVIISLTKEDKLGISFLMHILVPLLHMDKFVRSATGIMRTTKEGRKKILGKILLGFLFAVLALIIIIPLMISGDKAFSVLFNHFFNFEISSDTVVQTILFMIITLYSFGFIYFVFHKKESENDLTAKDHKAMLPIKDPNDLAHTLLTFLGLIGLVFLSFAVVQILYLFAKINANLPEDFSYAEYARSGFFQVWVLTMINMIIILAAEKKSRAITIVKARVFHVLFSAYVFINFAMTASAFYKMMMYESAYGLTRARLLVFIILILQILILLMLMYKIWIKSFHFFKVALILTLVFFIGVNYMNIDSIVARRNLTRFKTTQELDLDYLFESLSDDALKVLYNYGADELGYVPRAHYPKPTVSDFATALDYKNAQYLYMLSKALGDFRYDFRDPNWRELNLVDAQLNAIYSQNYMINRSN